MVVTKLTKWGNSQGIRLSKEILKSLNYYDEDIEKLEIKFELQVVNNKIILNPIKKITKLDILFQDFDGNADDYKVAVDWGEPVGKEVW